MKTVCKENHCNGCMACIEKCKQQAVSLLRSVENYNVVIDEKKCIHCNSCYNVCPRNKSNLDLVRPIKWFQGWAKDEMVRSHSSSGGIATTLMTSFAQNGGYVCSCIFREGEYIFEITKDVSEIMKFSGSKYVKSNPRSIYKKIQSLLMDGKKVLFIALPCQVAALKSFVGETNSCGLYTIDLICHGTPDPQILQDYLCDHGCKINELVDIRFRGKANSLSENDYRPVVTEGVQDRYMYSFLKKYSYTDNCYSCQFASVQRNADLTLGDSWGSNLATSEMERGISLLLIQNAKGQELVDLSSLELYDVDLEVAVAHNKQLIEPAHKTRERARFMKLYRRGKKLDRIVFRLAPKVFIKQDIKALLIRFHVLSKKEMQFSISVLKKKQG